MDERGRLRPLLECYDTAISELYVLDDRALIDLIVRLERRRKGVVAALTRLGASEATASVAGLAVPAPSP